MNNSENKFPHLKYEEGIDLFLKDKDVFSEKIDEIVIGTSSERKLENIKSIFQCLSPNTKIDTYPLFKEITQHIREIQPEQGEGVSDIAYHKAMSVINEMKIRSNLLVEDSAMYMVLDKFKNFEDFLQKNSKIGQHTKAFIKYELENADDGNINLGEHYFAKAIEISRSRDLKQIEEHEFYIKNQSAFSSATINNNDSLLAQGTGSGEMNLKFEVKDFDKYKTNRNFPAKVMNFSFVRKSSVEKLEELLSETDNSDSKYFKYRDESKEWIYFNDIYKQLKIDGRTDLLDLLTARMPSAIAYLSNYSK